MKNKIKQGLYPDMKDADYFGSAELTNSDFRLLSESALHHKNKDLFALGGGKFSFGSALHCLVLEPEEFESRYAVEDFKGSDLNKNSKAYKEAKAEWKKEVEGKDILSAEDHIKLKQMARNVNAIMGSFLTGRSEVAMFADMDDVLMSGKADHINDELRYIFDLKTTQSISKFGTSAVDYNYISQSALYPDIYEKITGKRYSFAFILVETVSPYMVSLQTAPTEMIEIGRSIYVEMIGRYKAFRDQGQVEIEKQVRLPSWFLKAQGYGEDLL